MSINPAIRDQAYQFFVEEAPELLQTIESGLLTLRENRDTQTVHSIMRAAHSIKGGSASVGLDAIQQIAHRLETIFKALYSDRVTIDAELETRLLMAYDTLRVPLMQTIETHDLNAATALSAADAVLTPLEATVEEAIQETRDFVPTSEDLGFSMTASIFEVDVAEGIQRIETALIDDPESIAGELRAQAEVFIGFSELLNLPEFGAIAQAVMAAVVDNPTEASAVASLAIADLQAGRDAVLKGQPVAPPSAALQQLAVPSAADTLIPERGDFEPVDLEPVDPEPVDLELVDLEPTDLDVEGLSVDELVPALVWEADDTDEVKDNGQNTAQSNGHEPWDLNPDVDALEGAAAMDDSDSAPPAPEAIAPEAASVAAAPDVLLDDAAALEGRDVGVAAGDTPAIAPPNQALPALAAEDEPSILSADTAPEPPDTADFNAPVAATPDFPLDDAEEGIGGPDSLITSATSPEAAVTLAPDNARPEVPEAAPETNPTAAQATVSPDAPPIDEAEPAATTDLPAAPTLTRLQDEAYQFFVEEAAELLDSIESGLLALRQDGDSNTVNQIMRAAHSIKGGAASVGLEAIKTIAHRLETIFKALYSDRLTVDAELETQLLAAFDCLRLPLTAQLTAGHFDPPAALAQADAVIAPLEVQFQEAIAETEDFVPSSSDFGIDMAAAIFEVDVAAGIAQLDQALTESPEAIAAMLQEQAEVFIGFAELLNIPGLGAIAQTALAALTAHPDRVTEIATLARDDFQASRAAVLAGDRTGGQPATALVQLAQPDDQAGLAFPDDQAPELADFAGDLDADLTEAWGSLTADVGEDFDGLEAVTEATPDSLVDNLADDFTNVPDSVSEAELSGLDSGHGASGLIEGTPDEPAQDPARDSAETGGNASTTTDEPASPDAEVDEGAEPMAINVMEPDTAEAIETAQEDGAASLSAPLREEDAIEPDLTAPPTSPAASEKELAVAEPEAAEPVPVTAESVDESAVDSEAEQSEPAAELPKPTDAAAEPSETAAEATKPTNATPKSPEPAPAARRPSAPASIAALTVRVDAERLARMNNLLGEITINRNGLDLQNTQAQGATRELHSRFERFQTAVEGIRSLSDQLLLMEQHAGAPQRSTPMDKAAVDERFDALEMDRYSALYAQTQLLLEEIVQLEEAVQDVSLFTQQTGQMLGRHRKMISQMQDELMWARMLPVGSLLSRFPRLLRDLSNRYGKPVKLTLQGTDLLVDKAVLEKLYDPLLHLLRNGFDHGIEPIADRQRRDKPAEGQISVRATYRGRQVVIEVSDDGQGLNSDRIRQRAVRMGLLSPAEAQQKTDEALYELIFEPGFSTAAQVSDLSGRGVGLDVVREQVRELNGRVRVSSTPGQGTTFTLLLPLTLTMLDLLICFVGSTPLAFRSSGITEIIIPKPGQTSTSGDQRFLHWQGKTLPIYNVDDLLTYNCLLPETPPSRVLSAVPSPSDWDSPLLILERDSEIVALQVDRLVTEQELVVKPFGQAIAPPSYAYGCTVLGDGSLVPVMDGLVFLDAIVARYQKDGVRSITAALDQTIRTTDQHDVVQITEAVTLLVIDDAVTSRRTLALSLERAGYRVLQARDGQEGVEQLEQNPDVKLIVCDVEMPNMNGFEFLTHRRQDAAIAAIPTVMLTSRSNDKHRWLAQQLGATDYFTKPYLEQEFLGAIATHLEAAEAALAPVS